MKIACPNCAQDYEIGPEHIGNTVECTCGMKFIVEPPKVSASNHSADKIPTKKQPSSEAEITIWEGRPSWIWYIPGLFFSGIFILIGLGGVWSLLVIGLIILISSLWRRFSQKYVLTSRRLIIHDGLIIKNECEVRLCDIRAISLKRGLIDFIFRTASVLLSTSNTAFISMKMKHLSDPKDIQEKINSLMKKYEST
jgi:membrane protein YdbS with pleckstrin-like domain